MTSWQDLIFFSGSFLFSIALVPSLLSPCDKPPSSTCILTATWLWVFAVAYLTLGLYLAGIGSIVGGALWWVLLLQRIRPFGERGRAAKRLEKAVQELQRAPR